MEIGEVKTQISEALQSDRFLEIFREISADTAARGQMEDVLQQELNRRHLDVTVFGILALPDAAGGGYQAKIDLKDNGPVAEFAFMQD